MFIVLDWVIGDNRTFVKPMDWGMLEVEKSFHYRLSNWPKMKSMCHNYYEQNCMKIFR